MMKVHVTVAWAIKERIGNEWVTILEKFNLLTTYGLTAFAAAPSGGYVAPVYLIIEQTKTTLVSSYIAGVSSIQTVADPTIGGDNQLVLGVGQVGQETVTYSSKTGSGPYTFTLTAPTINPHTSGDFVCRAVRSADTLASVVSEAQYDPTYAAGKRVAQTAFYSPATGQNTMQFFIAGIQATSIYFSHVGLADSPTIGAGNLHNYAAFGYNHNNTNDVEIDVTWALTTS